MDHVTQLEAALEQESAAIAVVGGKIGRKALPIAAAAPLTEAVEQLHRKKKIAKKQMKPTISF